MLRYLAERIVFPPQRIVCLTEETVETLYLLGEERRQLVDDKTRLTLRLQDCLKQYFPQLLRWFGDVDTPLVADLLQQLDNASWLEGRVRLVQDPTDADLRGLYDGCLFSLFPSWQEGWGLPVTEALGLGVPVLCSSAGALPEAGGGLARYFDPGDTAGCRAAVAALLDDPDDLAQWRADVRARFRPTSWSVTAEAVLEAARSLG